MQMLPVGQSPSTVQAPLLPQKPTHARPPDALVTHLQAGVVVEHVLELIVAHVNAAVQPQGPAVAHVEAVLFVPRVETGTQPLEPHLVPAGQQVTVGLADVPVTHWLRPGGQPQVLDELLRQATPLAQHASPHGVSPAAQQQFVVALMHVPVQQNGCSRLAGLVPHRTWPAAHPHVPVLALRQATPAAQQLVPHGVPLQVAAAPRNGLSTLAAAAAPAAPTNSLSTPLRLVCPAVAFDSSSNRSLTGPP